MEKKFVCTECKGGELCHYYCENPLVEGFSIVGCPLKPNDSTFGAKPVWKEEAHEKIYNGPESADTKIPKPTFAVGDRIKVTNAANCAKYCAFGLTDGQEGAIIGQPNHAWEYGAHAKFEDGTIYWLKSADIVKIPRFKAGQRVIVANPERASKYCHTDSCLTGEVTYIDTDLMHTPSEHFHINVLMDSGKSWFMDDIDLALEPEEVWDDVTVECRTTLSISGLIAVYHGSLEIFTLNFDGALKENFPGIYVLAESDDSRFRILCKVF